MTDRPRALTGLEWRLYLVALLGAIYVVTWRVLDERTAVSAAPREAPREAPLTPPAVAESRSIRPRDDRVRPPASRVVHRPSPRVVRVPAPRRVRTRSS